MGLSDYLELYYCGQPGDWPGKFYSRQVMYNLDPNRPYSDILDHITQFIGSLHVSLNGRENPLLIFLPYFKKAYREIFGPRHRPLADKPKPWRISMLLEITYGGWTLIREHILQVFHGSKDIQLLTLVNLLDNSLFSCPRFPKREKSGLLNNLQKLVQSIMIT